MKNLFLISFLFFSLNSYCQNHGNKPFKGNPETSSPLFNKYLRSQDSASFKITELVKLVEQAKEDRTKNDYTNAYKKLQVALELEKNTEPSQSTFDLNVYMSNFLADINPSYSINYLKKAVKISSQIKSVPPGTMFQLYGEIAGLYKKINQQDSAIIYYRKAKKEAPNAVKPNIAKASAANNLGIYYQNLNKLDSAQYYYNLALNEHSKNTVDSILFCAINDNIAELAKMKGDYATAIKTYRYNETVYKSSHRVNRFFINRVKLLSVLYKSENLNIDKEINTLTNFIDTTKAYINIHEIGVFYSFASDYFFKSNKIKEAEYFHNRLVKLKDKEEQESKDQLNLLTNTLLNVQSSQFKDELKVYDLELESTRQSLLFNRLVTAFSIITGAGIILLLTIYIRNRKKKHEAEKIVAEAELKAKDAEVKAREAELKTTEAEVMAKDAELKLIEAEVKTKNAELISKEAILKTKDAEVKAKDAELKAQELEKKAAQQELEMKKRDITNLVLHNTQVYDNNKIMIERLQNIAAIDIATERSLKSIVIDLKNKNQMAEGSLTVQNEIDSLNAAFYEKLKKRFPDLTKSEKELCGYVFINLSNKDIAGLKNVEPNSIKMSKTRLRKKLGLSPEDDLNLFIQNI